MHTKKAKAKFKLQVNNSVHETNIECPTGAEILHIAGFEDPNCYDLFLVRHGKDELIKVDQTVCLTDPGIERFRVRPRKVKDGFKGSESSLPFRDLEFLKNTFLGNWELKELDNLTLLLVRDFVLPTGYNVDKADMIIIIPEKYDSVQLDMAYFKPHLSRADNKPISRLTTRKFGTEEHQQWSRHRESDNQWIIGIDCIETHVELIRFFLRKELER